MIYYVGIYFFFVFFVFVFHIRHYLFGKHYIASHGFSLSRSIIIYLQSVFTFIPVFSLLQQWIPSVWSSLCDEILVTACMNDIHCASVLSSINNKYVAMLFWIWFIVYVIIVAEITTLLSTSCYYIFSFVCSIILTIFWIRYCIFIYLFLLTLILSAGKK